MKRCLEQVEARVDWLLHLESSPFSLNTHYLSDYRSKFLAYYKAEREKDERSDLVTLINAYNSANVETQPPGNQNSLGQPVGIAKVLAALSEIGVSGIKAEDLANLLPPDRMAPALEIMANVRAYFQGQNIFPITFYFANITISCVQAFHRHCSPCDRLRSRAWGRKGDFAVVVHESWH